MSKKRVIKDFDKLPKEVQDAVHAEYPNGFTHKLINYPGPKGVKIQALPFDLQDVSYLIRLSILEARAPNSKEEEDYDEAIGGKDVLNLDEMDTESSTDEGDGDDDYDGYSSKKRRNDDDEGDDDY